MTADNKRKLGQLILKNTIIIIIINVKEKFQLRLGSYAVNSRNLQLPIKGEPNLCVPLKWRTLRDHDIM